MIPKFNVLLTSYQLIRNDFKQFVRFDWKAIVIDEGQRIKSNESQLFKLSTCLKTEFRLLLSGTPLQNNLNELFNLMEYLAPTKFNYDFRVDFEKQFSNSIMIRQ